MERAGFVRICIHRIALGAGLAFAPTLLLPRGEAAGQAGATIVVTVVDAASLEPLEGAKIQLDGADTTAVADEEGRVSLDGVPEGDATLRARYPRYGSVVEIAAVSDAEVLFLQLQLPRIDAILSEIMVLGRAHAEEFERGHSEERVPGDAEVAATAADLLARGVPGLIVNSGGGLTGAGATVDIRGRSSITGSNTPAIYLDGIRIDERASVLPGNPGTQALQVLDMIPASEVKEIRVLRGPAAVARYEDSVNGVILIELRKGEPEGR